MTTDSTANAADFRRVIELESLGPLSAVERVVDVLRTASQVSVGNLWGASQALALAMIGARLRAPWLAVVSSEAEAEALVDDLQLFEARALWLPARETRDTKAAGPRSDPEAARLRLQAVQQIAGVEERRPTVIVASVLSMLQPIPSRDAMERNVVVLTIHQRLDVDTLLHRLIDAGYARQPLAEKPGEVSSRGEILDIYPFAAELPVRVELFDDVVESVRVFDPVDQRSVSSVPSVEFFLGADSADGEAGLSTMPHALLDPSTVFVAIEPLRIDERIEGLRIQSAAYARALMKYRAAGEQHRLIELQSLPGRDVNFDARSVQSLAVGIRDAPRVLRETTQDGTRVVVLCQTEAEEHRFRAVLDEAGGAAGVETRIGSASKGFRLPALKLVIVNHRELIGIAGRRAVARPHAGHRVRAIQSFFELKVGDLVVHAVHGLARYAGLKRLERAGGEEEHLHLLFADEVSLYVPASRIDLVQRYVGTGTAQPALDKIGSNAFRKRKERVEHALFDLATDLLEVQAQRSLRTRPPVPPDDELVRDMVAAFAYTDTKDQVIVDREIQVDLTSNRPMDRLLCGDVGFGKTELAIRAAFRVVNAGGQVAVLVPTTVLAQQHFETFRERLASFPVEIVTLSRYVSDAEVASLLERLAEGAIDVVIGTHRLLSKDVRFKRLKLLIVDEEQRFGVAHKEHFKRLRASVDILTLTATPIPRTLHMSLAGVRDISALTTPPEGRQDIETLLGYLQDEGTIVEAIRREKNRGGQVFYLHNRVDSIVQTALHLQQLLPDCSFAIGHGRMSARELKHVMDSFTRGDVDVLVATTIIESGIDIPSAGTIVIDHADHFGLSELHQLRGRVGRGVHKGYCYLLVDKFQPVRDVARERLKVLEEMNHLGAGFAISMKDLEIRGAGNILGPQQSGNIGAVGYDMYCRLLKHTIERIQAGGGARDASDGIAPEEENAEMELGLRAFLPEEWIPESRTRLELLREMSSIHGDEDADRVMEALHDRFGRVPTEAKALVRLFRLKAKLERLGIRRLTWHPGFYILEYTDRVMLERGLDLDRAELRPLRTGVAHLIVPARHATAEAALDWFEGLLQPDHETIHADARSVT